MHADCVQIRELARRLQWRENAAFLLVKALGFFLPR